ncbi:hypothetical protein BaRGS_00006351 [Batillaria attramentaria]|uniref:Uncharacterized protein n=1 Tax=Batillaria attramentaria TaxID=370345 RepID=A0ABD0LTE4_9CAEN
MAIITSTSFSKLPSFSAGPVTIPNNSLVFEVHRPVVRSHPPLHPPMKSFLRVHPTTWRASPYLPLNIMKLEPASFFFDPSKILLSPRTLSLSLSDAQRLPADRFYARTENIMKTCARGQSVMALFCDRLLGVIWSVATRHVTSALSNCCSGEGA